VNLHKPLPTNQTAQSNDAGHQGRISGAAINLLGTGLGVCGPPRAVDVLACRILGRGGCE
jgi:hypothetical protein